MRGTINNSVTSLGTSQTWNTNGEDEENDESASAAIECLIPTQINGKYISPSRIL